MEVLGSLPTIIGVRTSSRLTEKPLVDLTMVIDLEDEIEEEKEWELEPVRSTSTGEIAQREVEGQVDGTQTEEDENEALRRAGTADNPISFEPRFENNVVQRVDATSPMMMDAVAQGIGLGGRNDDVNDPFAFDNVEDAYWEEVAGLETSQRVDTGWLHGNCVDLSSSESGDDWDGDMGVIVEEPKKSITIVSRDDAAILAEIMTVIKEGGELKKLKIEHLKIYLRHYGLRMAGLKAVLLSRIQEHQKIKDGQAEELYPRSSFSIDCKGDVCLGDTVLFIQKVYDAGSFDIERRCASGPCLGQRWIAGKVVSENYGDEKQQHTFTIEVLWSSGMRPLNVMHPLLVKGRNLYRTLCLRQPWPNETERQKVLDEKHVRGGRARAYRRAMKSLKTRGRTKSRQDARVHPYLRNHTTTPHFMPPATPPNSVQYVSTHTEENVYQGSIPVRTPSMQHGTYTERVVHQGFTERYPAPEPTRHFHDQRSRYEGSAQAHHVPLRIHVRDSMQHGRVHTQRQVYQGDMASRNSAHPNHGRQQGAMTIPCSNARCEGLGAKHCISRSCGSCCRRSSTTRGRCPRHN